MAVLVPDDGNISRFQTVNHVRLAIGGGIEVALAVGASSYNRLPIWRNCKRGCIDPFGGNRLWCSSGKFLRIESHPFPRLVAGEDKALAVGKPARPLVIDRIVGERLGFTGPGGQQPEL